MGGYEGMGIEALVITVQNFMDGCSERQGIDSLIGIWHHALLEGIAHWLTPRWTESRLLKWAWLSIT
ncbi:MAG: hypothetical protein PsegKO_30360 [Pseudohongiellaceae bacterium]